MVRKARQTVPDSVMPHQVDWVVAALWYCGDSRTEANIPTKLTLFNAYQAATVLAADVFDRRRYQEGKDGERNKTCLYGTVRLKDT